MLTEIELRDEALRSHETKEPWGGFWERVRRDVYHATHYRTKNPKIFAVCTRRGWRDLVATLSRLHTHGRD